MNNYQVFLFDIDRTLFDFDKSERLALSKVFSNKGINLTESAFSFFSNANTQLWELLQQGKITNEQLRIDRFIALSKSLHIDFNPEEISTAYIDELANAADLMDDAEFVCKKLIDLGKDLYIVTNGSAFTQRARLNLSPLKNMFSKVYISEEIGAHKPQAEFFDYVFADIQKDKSKMVIIGDSLTADILGGNNAGISSCWFNPNKVKNNSGIKPKYEIDKLSQLVL